MNRKVAGAIKALASLSLAGGTLAAAAGPAAAATHNEAYGVAAAGLINIPPLGAAAYPGMSPVTVAHFNQANLVRTHVVTDTSDATSSSSTIVDPVVALPGMKEAWAKSVTSACSFDPNTGHVTGTSGIVGGGAMGQGMPYVALPANPAPNTVISVPGVAKITLNQQTTGMDGSLTVDAIYVQLLGRTQTLTLGTSVCEGASVAPVPVLPGLALPIGLGAIAMLALGGFGYQLSRRRAAAAAA